METENNVAKDKKSLTIQAAIKKCIEYTDTGNENSQELISFFQTFSSDANLCKSYEIISNEVYNLESDELEKLKNFIGISSNIKEPVADNIFQHDSFNEKQRENLAKFQRHIKLSYFQKEYIEKAASIASEKASLANKQAKKARKKVTSIYSEFIAILGIFTALSFALNGSFQILGTLFKDIKHPTSGSIGYSFIVGGLYLLIVYVVIVVLFEGMGKIVDEEAHYKINRPLSLGILILSVMMMIIGSGVLLVAELI